MSARDQRAETFKIQQDGGTKDGRKDKLKGKKFLNIKRLYTRRNWLFLDLAAKLKADKKKGITGNSLKGKNIALLFENQVQEQDVHLRSDVLMRVHTQNI